jgi:molybdate transport system substrate-binding protein
MSYKFFAAFSVVLIAFAQVTATSAEIKVLCAGAMKPALDDLVQSFERTTNHTVTINYTTAGVLSNRIEGGECADITILPKPVFEALVARGKIATGSSTVFAQSTIGVSVRAATPKPDISSVEAFKRSLLAATSIVYADPAVGAASGIHFASVLERLGIADVMKPKTRLVTSTEPGEVAKVVANGGAELAISQTIDLIRVSSADYVGPLPQELQNTSGFVFLVGLLAGAKEAETARAFIQHLQSPDAARVITSKGLTPGHG